MRTAYALSLFLAALPAWAQTEPAADAAPLDSEAEAASTEPAPPVSEDEQRFADAKRFFENGKIAYDVGRFEEAARQFERAYALRPAPLLLFNMAQCYRQLGDAKKSTFLYESFLRETAGAETPQVAIAIEELDALRAQVEAQRATEAKDPAADAEASAASGLASDPESEERAEPAADGSDDLLLWGAVGGGALVVAAAGATAVVLAVLASSPAPGDAGRIDFR